MSDTKADWEAEGFINRLTKRVQQLGAVNMPMKFTSEEKRDALAERLTTLAIDMLRSRDQGSDGRIYVTDDMMGDIRTAACVIALAEVHPVSGE